MIMLEDENGIDMKIFKDYVNNILKIMKNNSKVKDVFFLGMRFRNILIQDDFNRAKKAINDCFLKNTDEIKDLQLVLVQKLPLVDFKLSDMGKNADYNATKKITVGPITKPEYKNFFSYIADKMNYEGIFLDCDFTFEDIKLADSITESNIEIAFTKCSELNQKEIKRLGA
jgi:hypothetical protein